MNTTSKKNKVNVMVTTPPDRVNYISGKPLSPEDFTEEQEYHSGKKVGKRMGKKRIF